METLRNTVRAGQPHSHTASDAAIAWSPDRLPLFDHSVTVSRQNPDIPVCAECVAEMLDPSSRRYGYPFISCAACGPRHSILAHAPFVRANTSMARYAPCAGCRSEYETAGGRRQRDEAISCPSCGPVIRAFTDRGEAEGSPDAIRLAADAILDARIVAIRDERRDAFCCDATSPAAVSRLRARCGVPQQPLTVVVRDLDEASRVADLTARELSLLTSVERPVVLVSIRTDSPLTGEVAAGNRLVGLLLPYSPLHLLLLEKSGRPLVIIPAGVPDTLRRVSDAALRDAADLLLIADRAEAAAPERIDHRGADVVAGTAWHFRLTPPAARPILACGGGTPGTVCFAGGPEARLEIAGRADDDFDAILQFEKAVESVKSAAACEPEVVVHDFDERLYSTRFALDQHGVAHVAVQHHHAHMAACLAEHRETGTALGVVFDFGGMGPDDTIWGGEIFRGSVDGIERLATFHPIVLAGEHVSTRQVWRVALAMLDEVWSGEPPLHAIPMFRTMPRRGIEVVRRMLAAGPTILSHSIGIQLDALAAIVFGKLDAPMPGALAAKWDAAADRDETGRYPIVIRDGAQPWEIDFRPVVKCAVTEFIEGVAAPTIAGRVRNSLIAAVTEVLLAHGGDRTPVAITGDYFELTTLAGSLADSLGPAAMVLRPRALPGDDRAVAFGQVVISDALLRGVPARARASSRFNS